MSLRLDALTREECELARTWRNDALDTLRTPFRLTAEMQSRFYDDVICDRRSPHRFYAIKFDKKLIGMGGLINIVWEAGIAEISLIMSPTWRGGGYGTRAAELLLAEGFDRLRLSTIVGEVYHTNPARAFWERLTVAHGGVSTVIPMRTFQGGRHVDGTFFTIPAPMFRKAISA